MPKFLTCFVLALVLQQARAQFPTVVGQYERATFASFAVGGLANPFAQVKIRAVFRHLGSSHDFRMPVVCTSVTPQGAAVFPVIFTPPIQGTWTWWIEVLGSPMTLSLPGMPTASAPASFTCTASTARGWWRPDTSSASGVGTGNFPFAIIEPRSRGTQYVWPLSTAYISLLNPYWLNTPYPHPTCVNGAPPSLSLYTDALDWARASGFNRIRAFLTAATSRSPLVQAPPWHPSCTANHTVFEHAAPQTAGWAIGVPAPAPSPPPPGVYIDFERFDLTQWSWIDAIVDLCRTRELQLSITVTFNTTELDYEEHYLAVPPPQTAYASPAPPTPIAMTSPQSAFAHRHEFYYWYVVGRLAAYTNVHWSLMHEHDNGSPSAAAIEHRPYPSWWVKWFGDQFRSIEPYLSWDVDSKIVDTTPARGTLYAENPYGSTRFQNLSSNVSRFLTSDHDTWRSCIGLQRGGELGVTSLYGAQPMLSPLPPGALGEGPPPWFPGTVAHRTVLLNGFDHDANALTPALPTTPRPIFIEEDWVTRNVTSSGASAVAASFSNQRNPYCFTAQSPATFSFLTSNDDGLRKYYRDAAWMTGFIGQAYLCWWGPGRDDLTVPVTTTAWKPLAAAAAWARALEAHRFQPAPGLVVGQNPPVPNFTDDAGSVRPRIELAAVGAKTSGPVPKYIVYCPYAGTTTNLQSQAIPGPAQVDLNLSELGANAPFTYYFVHPETGQPSRHARGTTGATPSDVPFPLPPASARGPHGEYVLIIN